MKRLQVVIPDRPPIEAVKDKKKTMLHKLWSTDLGKAVTASELKTLSTETAYEGRTYFNRTATTLWERAKGLTDLILSPKKDVPLEKQLDTALRGENKSEGWLKGSLSYFAVFLLFWVTIQVIAKTN